MGRLDPCEWRRAASSGEHAHAAYPSRVNALNQLPEVGAPAARALEAAGYGSLADLAGVPKRHLTSLHGVGPKAIRIIQGALEEHRLTLT
jgi:hypothetical protein